MRVRSLHSFWGIPRSPAVGPLWLPKGVSFERLNSCSRRDEMNEPVILGPDNELS